jgi:asparagine synthase (glutamine-hydrolysing)
VRPLNYALLHVPGELQDMFRSHDAELTQSPLEVRYPFMDLRLLRFLLIVPPIPWCRAKYLLRIAMKGNLPDAVLRRPKEGMPTEVLMERIERGRTELARTAPEFGTYVDAHKLPVKASDNMWAAGGIMTARLLNHWLQYSYRDG